MNESQQYCTFTLASSLFGVEVEKVQEIIRYQEMTRIPQAPPAVAGLINLRGDIVPAIDLRRCLRFPDLGGDALPTNVVVRSDEGAVSFLVDDIGDVVNVQEDAFEPPPDNLKGAMRDKVLGVYKLEKGLLMVLDVSSAIHAATFELTGQTDQPTEA